MTAMMRVTLFSNTNSTAHMSAILVHLTCKFRILFPNSTPEIHTENLVLRIRLYVARFLFIYFLNKDSKCIE